MFKEKHPFSKGSRLKRIPFDHNLQFTERRRSSDTWYYHLSDRKKIHNAATLPIIDGKLVYPSRRTYKPEKTVKPLTSTNHATIKLCEEGNF